MTPTTTKKLTFEEYLEAEYQAVRIPEYWIVDFFNPKVTVLQLVEGLYEAREFVGSNERIISRTFSELELSISQVLDV